jgi:high-affinity iron transporter
VLATFVIGLREGLEAALIVGIIAAFVKQRGRQDLLTRVWSGVALAVALCLIAAVGLQVLNSSLPQREQEQLETVIGIAAVAMVSYMVVWMSRHSRQLKGDLQQATAVALASGSGWALVAMAFAAVLREGLETAVFLLATFQASDNATLASLGAVLGIAVAVALGYGLYRGAVRINLGRFFAVTTAMLILVAAGLVMTSLHTAHEGTWLNVGQEPLLNLTWLVRPGSAQAAILTGMLGLQPRPTQVEVGGWVLYVVIAGLFIFWPRPGRRRVHVGGSSTHQSPGVAVQPGSGGYGAVVPGRADTGSGHGSERASGGTGDARQ